jgi:alpha/beta superfamily hydrolase
VNKVAATAIGAQTILPAAREVFWTQADDGTKLVGEVALPPGETPPAGTLLLLHPLPTEGGSMDSHLFRKAAWRLPALANLAVVRFNTRGTCSRAGCSDGHFDGGAGEGRDVAAMVRWVAGRGLPRPWLVGWSFGSEVALMHGHRLDVEGVIALSPPLRRTKAEHLVQWAANRKPIHAIVPERDRFLSPAAARARLGMVPAARVVEGKDAVHLWIGEKSVRQVLDAIVEIVRPGFGPLPTDWHGPVQVYGHEEEPAATAAPDTSPFNSQRGTL